MHVCEWKNILRGGGRGWFSVNSVFMSYAERGRFLFSILEVISNERTN